jgi:hypothetical protein
MRIASAFVGICAVLSCSCVKAPSGPPAQAAPRPKTVPLILERDEGGRPDPLIELPDTCRSPPAPAISSMDSEFHRGGRTL